MRIGVCCHDGGEAGGATVQLDGTIGLLDLDQYHTVEPEPPTDLVARSRIDCRETLRRLCHIRLNDQSVGQGRWPIIIGSLTLD